MSPLEEESEPAQTRESDTCPKQSNSPSLQDRCCDFHTLHRGRQSQYKSSGPQGKKKIRTSVMDFATSPARQVDIGKKIQHLNMKRLCNCLPLEDYQTLG